jgi:hypothetical protein
VRCLLSPNHRPAWRRVLGRRHALELGRCGSRPAPRNSVPPSLSSGPQSQVRGSPHRRRPARARRGEPRHGGSAPSPDTDWGAAQRRRVTRLSAGPAGCLPAQRTGATRLGTAASAAPSLWVVSDADSDSPPAAPGSVGCPVRAGPHAVELRVPFACRDGSSPALRPPGTVAGESRSDSDRRTGRGTVAVKHRDTVLRKLQRLGRQLPAELRQPTRRLDSLPSVRVPLRVMTQSDKGSKF